MNSMSELQAVLIVDDSPTNLEFLSEALSRAGLQVAVALNGETAIERAASFQPELILLDVLMSGIDGFETCRRLKNNPLTKDIPVIFMTALSDMENKVKGLSLGAVDYITKPFREQEVLARVNIHLQLRSFAKRLAAKNKLLKQEVEQREKAEAALLKLNQELEQRVEERTAELCRAMQALQRTQVQLVQQEKLSTLGELVAGVAHEINNPIGFISNNIAPAQEYVSALTKILQFYQKYYPQPVPEIQNESEAVDLEFVLEDLPKLLDSMKLGTERIKNISVSLRNFSRSDTRTKMAANLHEGLDSTLLILRHRLKACGDRPAIEVIKNYGNLQEIECYPGQINQVFMNIIANAVDAVEEAFNLGSITQPIVKITTELEQREENISPIADRPALISQFVVIRIADNGLGMTEEIKNQLFEPMFTTKAVGKGTGLGLSIAQQIVVEKHGGQLSFTSEPGQGTEFAIAIPINQNSSSKPGV